MFTFVVVIYLTAVQLITPPVAAGLMGAVAVDTFVHVEVVRNKR